MPGKGKPFGPGNKPKGGSKPGRVRRDPSEMLAAYRHVFRTGTGEDQTEEHRKLRKQYEENPDKFIDQLNRLEIAHANKGSGSAAVGGGTSGLIEGAGTPPASDEGEERVLELIERLLEEWNSGAGQAGG